ncbi:MAG: efflux RND transporter periplasmic adaptor subunit [Victivallaceae bacterium]
MNRLFKLFSDRCGWARLYSAGCLLTAGMMAAMPCNLNADNEIQTEEYPTKVVIFPFRQAVISAEVDTAVKQYKFKEGECFKEGDVIAVLDDRVYLQKYEKAKSAQLEADAGMQFALKNFNRNEDLYKKGMQGMQDVEKSELEKDIATSKLNFSIANMKMAEIDLKACRLIAPFAGRLIKKQVQEHEFVRGSQPVISIIDDYQLLAVMHLPSSEMNKIAIGQSMRVWIDETRSEHEGSIYVISGEIDPGSRTFEIKVLIDNRKRKLAAGMSGKLMKQYDKNSGKK